MSLVPARLREIEDAADILRTYGPGTETLVAVKRVLRHDLGESSPLVAAANDPDLPPQHRAYVGELLSLLGRVARASGLNDSDEATERLGISPQAAADRIAQLAGKLSTPANPVIVLDRNDVTDKYRDALIELQLHLVALESPPRESSDEWQAISDSVEKLRRLAERHPNQFETPKHDRDFADLLGHLAELFRLDEPASGLCGPVDQITLEVLSRLIHSLGRPFAVGGRALGHSHLLEQFPFGRFVPSRKTNSEVVVREAKVEVDAAHSTDFRSVRWFGEQFTFTATQAACVKVLWGNWEQGTPVIGEVTILDDAGSAGDRLRDVFDKGKHPAWGSLIKPAGKGAFRLAEPDES